MRFWLPLSLLLFVAGAAHGQDALTVAPDVYKRAFENERMRVLEANLRPKSKADWHSHPEHLLYMLSEGTLVFQSQNKKPYEMSFAAGQTLLLPAQTSAIENDSDKPVRFLVVELKGARAAPPAPAVVAARPGRAVSAAGPGRPARAARGRAAAGRAARRSSRAAGRGRGTRRR